MRFGAYRQPMQLTPASAPMHEVWVSDGTESGMVQKKVSSAEPLPDIETTDVDLLLKGKIPLERVNTAVIQQEFSNKLAAIENADFDQPEEIPF